MAFPQQLEVRLKSSACGVCVPAASTTEPPATLPRLHVRDVNRRHGHYHPIGLPFYIFFLSLVKKGLSSTEFLSSIEQFDKSSASWNVPLQRDWRIINHVLNSARYEMAVASIPISRIGVCTKNIDFTVVGFHVLYLVRR